MISHKYTNTISHIYTTSPKNKHQGYIKRAQSKSQGIGAIGPHTEFHDIERDMLVFDALHTERFAIKRPRTVT